MTDEDEAYHIDDDDGGTDADGDICEGCDCARVDHEEGNGRCNRCGSCNKFKEST